MDLPPYPRPIHHQHLDRDTETLPTREMRGTETQTEVEKVNDRSLLSTNETTTGKATKGIIHYLGEAHTRSLPFSTKPYAVHPFNITRIMLVVVHCLGRHPHPWAPHVHLRKCGDKNSQQISCPCCVAEVMARKTKPKRLNAWKAASKCNYCNTLLKMKGINHCLNNAVQTYDGCTSILDPKPDPTTIKAGESKQTFENVTLRPRDRLPFISSEYRSQMKRINALGLEAPSTPFATKSMRYVHSSERINVRKFGRVDPLIHRQPRTCDNEKVHTTWITADTFRAAAEKYKNLETHQQSSGTSTENAEQSCDTNSFDDLPPLEAAFGHYEEVD